MLNHFKVIIIIYDYIRRAAIAVYMSVADIPTHAYYRALGMTVPVCTAAIDGRTVELVAFLQSRRSLGRINSTACLAQVS